MPPISAAAELRSFSGMACRKASGTGFSDQRLHTSARLIVLPLRMSSQTPASYKMNPLWEACVRGTQFHQFGSVKKSKGRSHINVKEMSAALNAERRLGAAQPNKYYIHLQDSQVSLAALIKGRSSSTALNRLLRKSVPHHVSSNVRAFYGYVCSALNPADDPTRKQPDSYSLSLSAYLVG